MSDNPPPPPASTPADDAERIRLKRLAKLGNASATSSSAGAASSSSTPAPATPAPRPAAAPAPTPRKITPSVFAPSPAPVVVPTRKPAAPAAAGQLNVKQWEHDTIAAVFQVTLDRDAAEREHWNIAWLKSLAGELRSSDSNHTLRLDSDIVDQLLISRLELPNAMTDDPEILQVVASLPANQTIFEYLVGCWKRLNVARTALLKKNYNKDDVAKATPIIDRLRDLIVSYVGLTLQTPDMFPQPSRPVGHPELVDALMKMSSFSGPLHGSSSDRVLLGPGEMEQLIGELGRRFEDDGLEDILGPVVELVVWKNEALLRPAGLGGGDMGWRQAVSAVEALVSSKQVATMITRLPNWSPVNVPPHLLEFACLMGPLLRLHIMPREWPQIAKTYFSDLDKRTQADVSSSNANLRATLVALQNSLFQIFNAIVRASPEAREGVLALFSRILNANWRRSGSHVNMASVASDGFFLNIYAVLLRFSEPFMDAKYSKLDRIDPTYLSRSSRVNVSQQTKLKATSEDVAEWKKSLPQDDAPPNFITEIFYLTAAFGHLGMQKAIANRDKLAKEVNRIRRELQGAEEGRQQEDQASIQQMKDFVALGNSHVYTMQVQLLEPDIVFRTFSFAGFTSAWLVRILDPTKTYPAQQIELPLPKEISRTFAMLPEFFVEDILEFVLHILRFNSDMINSVARKETLEFILTFLTSTWYINNPYLRAKLVQILFQGTDAGVAYNSRGRQGVFSDLIITNPIALKHLMKTLVEFYVDVEITGTHGQFFEKFDYRKNVAHIMQEIWDHPVHRKNLGILAQDMPFFTRFINLLMNDTTFVLDESIGKLGEIYEIQKDMENTEEWNARPENEQKDKLAMLKQLEASVPFWVDMANTNLELFNKFTVQTRGPFVTGEIVERLAAMLAYNLDMLAGPRCGNLKVKDMEKKFGFKPRELLSEIMQVFINLGEEPDFVRAIANEGRSYSRKTFTHAGAIARRYVLKSEKELDQFALFIENVEQMKRSIEEDDDFGEIPDEFLDPLMYTIMRDPVTLPSSHTNIDLATIKAHLLSDASDPFNRVPLKIEDVVPNAELKQQITDFIAECRRKKREARAAAQQQDEVMADA